MRSLIILTIFAGLLVAGFAVAESLPSVSPNEPSSNNANKPSYNEQGYKHYKTDTTLKSRPSAKIGWVKDVGPETDATDSNNKTKDDNSYDIWRWPPSSGWAIVFVTIAYVIVAFAQWCAIHRQANISQKALTTSERAWIGFGFDRPYILGNDCIDLQIFNSGKSVGHIKDIQLFGFEAVAKGERISDKPKPVQPPGLGTWSIFPGESTPQRWDVRLEPEDIPGIAEKTKLLPIHGHIKYVDIFGNEHITKLYRVWMSDKGPMDGIFAIPPDAAPGQNEAT